MKKTLLAIIALAALLASPKAQNPPTPEPMPPMEPLPVKSWWTDFSVTPFGAVSHLDFQGEPTWGAGLDLGYYVNNTLSIHASAMGNETHDWHGSAIKEASAIFKADLIRDSRERFVGSLLGSVDRYFDNDKEHSDGWGIGVGAGGELRLSKNFSIGIDYRVRFRENEDIGSLGRGFFRIRL